MWQTLNSLSADSLYKLSIGPGVSNTFIQLKSVISRHLEINDLKLSL